LEVEDPTVLARTPRPEWRVKTRAAGLVALRSGYARPPANQTGQPTCRWPANFAVARHGTLSQPKLSKIKGMEAFKGHSFHTSRFDYRYTGEDLSKLKDKTVGIIGTGSTAVQIIPRVGAAAKAFYVFQRTPSPIDIRDDLSSPGEFSPNRATENRPLRCARDAIATP
jgi:cation diffusion facilitator CzcD-associated flavoprotein CzcO